MLRTRLVLPVLVLVCALAFVPAAPAKKKSQKGPSKTVITRLLKDHYLGDDPTNYPQNQYSYKVDKITRGAARKGNHWSDGTPANKKTTVYPIHAKSTRTVLYSDGSKTITKFDGKYVFFKDEFGEWTFTIKSEHSTVSH